MTKLQKTVSVKGQWKAKRCSLCGKQYGSISQSCALYIRANNLLLCVYPKERTASINPTPRFALECSSSIIPNLHTGMTTHIPSFIE